MTELSVTEALKARISTRAFLDRPVPEATVRDLLDIARFAPSGGNLQPWEVIAVAGEAKAAVTAVGRAALMKAAKGEDPDNPVYPPSLWEPYRSRRYQVGEDMYALLGIPRADKAKRLQWVARNYDFFGAPVGLFFLIDRRMGRGQWAHLGMFMQSLALAATARGLATCMQEAWAQVRVSLAAHFGLEETKMVYCGLALGWPDPDHPVNRLRSAREPVEGFARFEGF